MNRKLIAALSLSVLCGSLVFGATGENWAPVAAVRAILTTAGGMAKTVATSQAVAKKVSAKSNAGQYCNGQQRETSDGESVYPNGQRVRVNRGQDIYPDNQRLWVNPGQPLYPNGARLWINDDASTGAHEYLYPNGQRIWTNYDHFYYPNGREVGACSSSFRARMKFDRYRLTLDFDCTSKSITRLSYEYQENRGYTILFDVDLGNGNGSVSNIDAYCPD